MNRKILYFNFLHINITGNFTFTLFRIQFKFKSKCQIGRQLEIVFEISFLFFLLSLSLNYI